jgi:hypothetical protein
VQYRVCQVTKLGEAHVPPPGGHGVEVLDVRLMGHIQWAS